MQYRPGRAGKAEADEGGGRTPKQILLPVPNCFLRTTFNLLVISPADHLWIEVGDFPEHKVKPHNLDDKQWQPYHFLAFNPRHVHLPSIGKWIHFCLTFSKCSAVKLWFSPGALIYTEKYNIWPICFSLFTGINNINTIPAKPEAEDLHFENNKG